MFIVPAPESPITQGDILNECPLVGLDATEPPSDPRNIPVQRWRARVIVLTQACDLGQAKSGRVLVAQVHDAQKLVEAGVLRGPIVRDQMRRHMVFGWYFLPAATAPVLLSESLMRRNRKKTCWHVPGVNHLDAVRVLQQAGNHASSSLTTRAGSTPVKRWSRPR
jgi:hypothetical protein